MGSLTRDPESFTKFLLKGILSKSLGAVTGQRLHSAARHYHSHMNILIAIRIVIGLRLHEEDDIEQTVLY